MGGRQILGVVLVALGLVAVVVGLVGLLGRLFGRSALIEVTS